MTAARSKNWSTGMSTKQGPRGAETAEARAAATSGAMSSVVAAVTARFVTSATIATWSTSWSDPVPHREAGARPPITTIGEPEKKALVMALMPLVTPGPAVRAATPGRRVTLAQPSAAKPAVCSWRVSTSRMPGGHTAVVEREKVPAGQGEHDVDTDRAESAWRPGCPRGQEAGGYKPNPPVARSGLQPPVPD